MLKTVLGVVLITSAEAYSLKQMRPKPSPQNPLDTFNSDPPSYQDPPLLSHTNSQHRPRPLAHQRHGPRGDDLPHNHNAYLTPRRPQNYDDGYGKFDRLGANRADWNAQAYSRHHDFTRLKENHADFSALHVNYANNHQLGPIDPNVFRHSRVRRRTEQGNVYFDNGDFYGGQADLFGDYGPYRSPLKNYGVEGFGLKNHHSSGYKAQGYGYWNWWPAHN